MSATTISAMRLKKNANAPQPNADRPLRRAIAAVHAMIKIQMMKPTTAPIKVAVEFVPVVRNMKQLPSEWGSPR